MFCVSQHFRTEDEAAVRESVTRCGGREFHVMPPENGWTTLLDKRAAQQDSEWIQELTAAVTRDLGIAAVAFLVHDSDIACYWLYDSGDLLDEYNSCPDYFEMDSLDGSGPSGGNAETLRRYCLRDVSVAELDEILTAETVFAEEILEQLATVLGIGPECAFGSYEDKSDPLSPAPPNPRINLSSGLENVATDADSQALVQAASVGEISDIGRLLDAGVSVNVVSMFSPVPQPGFELTPFPATPLLVAILYKQDQATRFLLQRGADPNYNNPNYGVPLHLAIRTGDAASVKLLIEAGADVNSVNVAGQTALQMLSSFRSMCDAMQRTSGFLKVQGASAPGLVFPIDGWEECERLLRSSGAS
jgi:hypothetical protein